MNVSVLGIGNYSEVIIELCQETGYTIDSLYHFNSSRTGEIVSGYEIKGTYDDFLDRKSPGSKVVVAVGDNKIRSTWLNKLRAAGYATISLIHPSAYISCSAQIGSGVYIHAHSFVWTKSRIADNVIISPHALVAHHTQIGEGSLISANAVVGSYVTLEDQVLMGINSGVISGKITLGAHSTIGANAMVIRNVDQDSVVVGTPGKKINDPEL